MLGKPAVKKRGRAGQVARGVNVLYGVGSGEDRQWIGSKRMSTCDSSLLPLSKP